MLDLSHYFNAEFALDKVGSVLTSSFKSILDNAWKTQQLAFITIDSTLYSRKSIDFPSTRYGIARFPGFLTRK